MSLLYENNTAWKLVHRYLPEEMHLQGSELPSEEFFSWRDSRLHVDRYDQPDAPFKVILHHGVGTNGRLLSLIVGAPLAKRGLSVAAIDMPYYGMTENNESLVSYDDWVEISSQFIDAEIQRDGKPVVLYGLSAGGMLCYHVACVNPKVEGIVGMCFLDQSEPGLHEIMAPGPGDIAPEDVVDLATVTQPEEMVHVKGLCKMTSLANHKDAVNVLLKDTASAGAKVSLHFLQTMMEYRPAIAYEDFDVCPILLTQPEKDTWTPLSASKPFFYDKLNVKKSIMMLENAGHYPMEQPGLKQLEDSVVEFLQSLRNPEPS